MKILILDDAQERHEWFKRNLSGTLFHAYTAGEAALLAKQERPDVLYLDHDLGENAGNGEGFARLFCMTFACDNYRPRIVIHSHNFGGRKRMKEIFEQNGYSAEVWPFRL